MPVKKRGKRKKSKGSTSSGDSPVTHAPKKYNLGEESAMQTATAITDLTEAVHEAGILAEAEQPSLQELWKVLSRIENNTSTLLAENAGLKASLEFSQAQCVALERQNKTLQERVLAVEGKETETYKKIEDLEAKYDDLEQYSRKVNLEIHGIPEMEGEDTTNIILDLAETLNVELQEEDIDISHRLFKGEGKPRPIIAKFANYSSKSEIYSARLKLRNLNLASKFGSEKIFINENLTKRRATLYSKVRKKIKTLHTPHAKSWTIDGKIFVKTTPTGRRIRIYSEEDITKIVN